MFSTYGGDSVMVTGPGHSRFRRVPQPPTTSHDPETPELPTDQNCDSSFALEIQHDLQPELANGLWRDTFPEANVHRSRAPLQAQLPKLSSFSLDVQQYSVGSDSVQRRFHGTERAGERPSGGNRSDDASPDPSCAPAEDPRNVMRTFSIDRELYQHYTAGTQVRNSARSFLTHAFDVYYSFLDRCPLTNRSRSSSGGKDGMENTTPLYLRRSIFLLPLISPDHVSAHLWGSVLLLTDGMYTAFLVPMSFAFLDDLSSWDWLAVMDAVFGTVYIMDLILSFSLGFVAKYHASRTPVLDGRYIAEHYIAGGTFVADIIAASTTIPEVVILSIPSYRSSLASTLLGTLRLLRLLRLLKLVRALYYASLGGKTLVSKLPMSVSSVFLLNALYFAMVTINFLACVWCFTGRQEGEDGWLTRAGDENLLDAASWHQYWASVYFIMTTVTTIGYGNVAPGNTTEYIVSTFIMLSGVIFFGIVIALISDIISRSGKKLRRAAMLREKMEDVEMWAKRRQLPKDLRRQVQSYFSDAWIRHAEEESDCVHFLQLPWDLRTEVALQLAARVFKKSDILSCLDKDCQREIAGRLRPVVVAAGQHICQQGDEADRLWMLEEGQVLVMRHTHALRVANPPGLLGQSAILSHVLRQSQHRPVTLRAITSCTLWELKTQDLHPLAHAYPELESRLVDAFRKTAMRHLASSPTGNGDKWQKIMDQLDEAQAQRDRQMARESTLSGMSSDDLNEITATNSPDEEHTATDTPMSDMQSPASME